MLARAALYQRPVKAQDGRTHRRDLMKLPRKPVLLAALLLACHEDPAPTPGPATTSRAPATEAAPASEAAPARAPDPGPTLKRATGPVPAESLPDVAVEATAKHAAAGHFLLAAPLPADFAPDEPLDARIDVRGDRYGVAVVEAPSGQPARILVRLAGDAAPGDLTLHATRAARRATGGSEAAPGRRQTITVKGAGAAKADAKLTAGFHAAASAWFDRLGRVDWRTTVPFYQFASGRLALLAGKAAGGRGAAQTPPSRTEIAELMSLYSGMQSINEALQHDRGLRLAADAAKATIPVATIAGVPLPAHPWDAMIAELKKAPAVEPLASFVPHDALYVHFHDLRSLVAFAREIDEWMTPLGRVVEASSGDRHFTNAYERQIVIERTILSEKLGHLAAKGVALVAADPFLREGTGLALMFHVRDRTLLETTLGAFEAKARAAHADLKEETWRAGERDVRLLATPDRVVHQHKVWLADDVLVLSNSKALVERLAAVKDGKATPLAGSGDFKYMRAVYPFDEKAEDGFVFISDAFVQKVTGPRAKVLAARRMAAAADLAAVAHAALLHGWLEGRRPADLADLVKSGYLDAAEAKHADGTPIAFDPERGPSSAWGRPSMLVPIDEHALDLVTEAEKSAYEQFRDGYQRYWRQFVDPVGVRVRRVDAGRAFALDARMLPIIEDTEYDDVIELVGDTQVAMASPGDGLRFTFAVGRQAKLRAELDQLGRAITGQDKVGLSWLGDWVMVGVGDHSALWDLAIMDGDIPGGARPEDLDSRAEQAFIARAPFYAGVHVKDKLALGAALTALRTFQQQAARDFIEWTEDGLHRDVGVSVLREKTDGSRPASPLAVYYAMPKDTFVVAINRPTVEALIDDVLAGRVPGAAGGEMSQAAFEVRPLAGDGWLVKTLLGLIEKGVTDGHTAAAHAEMALRRGLPGANLDGDAHRAAGLTWLGAEPLSPQGGAFSVVDGVLTHSIYGSEVAPVVPEIPVPGAPVGDIAAKLASLRMALAFEGEKAHRALHATAGWENRAK
jgi:hypothetical protein